jgi:hypothetical protein
VTRKEAPPVDRAGGVLGRAHGSGAERRAGAEFGARLPDHGQRVGGGQRDLDGLDALLCEGAYGAQGGGGVLATDDRQQAVGAERFHQVHGSGLSSGVGCGGLAVVTIR